MRNALAGLRASADRIRKITFDIDANIALALQDRDVLQRHQTTQCALTVILSGYLESFLKEVAEAFVSEINTLKIPFSALPDRMQRAHFEVGGQILTNRMRNRLEWVSSSPNEIARRLGSVSSFPYELVWEAFADTKQNPGPDTIEDYLFRFGLKKPWFSVTSKVVVRKSSWSKNTITTRLRSFIQVRNECAHSGQASIIPTPNDVREYCELIEEIGPAINIYDRFWTEIKSK